jgi:sugar lactone lactonase YvrE
MRFELRPLVDGLCFGEGPRWRDGKLWFSDMHAHQVMTVDTEGKLETVVRVPEQPSGLGWLPDGRLLVVSMRDRRVLRLEDGGLEEHADLSKLASYHCNDMVVDARGRAYVGNFGSDHESGGMPTPTNLVLVTPDGVAREVASDLLFPNGTVITPDGATLVVGESYGGCLTAFDIEADGSLTGRRVWAEIPGKVPDGICLDAEGAIWVTSPITREVLRVREGGEVTHTLQPERMPFACMLGGDERRTLFVLTANSFVGAETQQQRAGRIDSAEVEVVGAGYP